MFNIGDQVRCIRDTDSHNGLHKGEIYRVTSRLSPMFSKNEQQIALAEIGGFFKSDRFILYIDPIDTLLEVLNPN